MGVIGVSHVYQMFGIFLLVFAITDYMSLRIEVLMSGIAVLALVVRYLPVVGMVPVASALFVAVMVLLALKSRYTLPAALALIPVSLWYMWEFRDPVVSGYLWMLIGAAFGIIDNSFLKATMAGDIIITIVLFVAAGPLAIPIYGAHSVYGKLFLEREVDGRMVFPFATAVFVGYLSLMWGVYYLANAVPWIIP